jgi:NAD(P)H-hydrate epimerase
VVFSWFAKRRFDLPTTGPPAIIKNDPDTTNGCLEAPEPSIMPTRFFTREQIRHVDKAAIEDFGMSGLVLMENAGRGCADVLSTLGVGGPVVICCGKGNNAGDGFVIARHLDLRGHKVRVLMWSDPAELQGDAAANFAILQKAGIEFDVCRHGFDADWLAERLLGAVWIVDAVLGTGAQGAPRAPFDQVIDALNAADARRLAVDVPSGLDCDSGQPSEHTFHADHTCTFVAAKVGFQAEAAQPWLGQVHVVDIGAPRKLLESLG